MRDAPAASGFSMPRVDTDQSSAAEKPQLVHFQEMSQGRYGLPEDIEAVPSEARIVCLAEALR